MRTAIEAHRRHYLVGEEASASSRSLYVVDKTRDPAVVTLLTMGNDGSVHAAVRYRTPLAMIQSGVSPLAPDGRVDTDRDFHLSDVLEYFGLRTGRQSTFAADFVARFLIEHPRTDIATEELAAIAGDMVSGEALAGWINTDALQALRCVSKFSANAYQFYAAAGERGVVRRQAANAYPLLANEIVSRINVKLAVDTKKSPADALMAAYGKSADGTAKLSKSLLKKLAGKPYADLGVSTQVIVDALSRIPADWFPKDEAEWGAFVDIADAFFRRLGPDFQDDISGLTAGAAGKWVEFADRLARSYANTYPPDDLPEADKAAWRPTPDRTRPAMIEAAEATRDLILAFRNLVLLPVAARAAGGALVLVGPEQLRLANDLAASILFSGKALPSVLETQRHWHTQAHNIVDAAQNAVPVTFKEVAEDGWPPLTDMVVAPNGVTLYPLTDPRELAAEGAHGKDENGVEGLHHCVGGYSGNCRAGTSHIVSLRLVEIDGSFRRLSTAEISNMPADAEKVTVRQHHGTGNHQPPAAAMEAFAWYCEEIEAGRMPLNREGLMTYLAGRRKVAEEVEAYSDYNWREDGAIEAAFEPWRAYLPKKYRENGLAGLQASAEVKALAESLAPTYSHAMTR